MGERTSVTTADGPVEAYLAGAPGDPGVLFYVDAIGLRPRIEDMADRIASWGYLVLVPHVFHRWGSAAELAPTTDLREPGAREAFWGSGVMDRVDGLTPDLAESDAAAWLAALGEHAGDGPVGVTGYCMGVRLAVRTAGWHPDRVPGRGWVARGWPRHSRARQPAPRPRGVPRRVRLRARRPRPLDAAGGRRRPRRGADRRRSPAHQRGLRGRRPRLHHGRHVGLRRGRGRAALRRAARPPRPHPALDSDPERRREPPEQQAEGGAVLVVERGEEARLVGDVVVHRGVDDTAPLRREDDGARAAVGVARAAARRGRAPRGGRAASRPRRTSRGSARRARRGSGRTARPAGAGWRGRRSRPRPARAARRRRRARGSGRWRRGGRGR